MARGARKRWDVEQLRDRYVEAALQVLQEEGPDGFTLRRVAERAGASTMGVYTRFEGRPGLVRAVCQTGLCQLRDSLLLALRHPDRPDPVRGRPRPRTGGSGPAGHGRQDRDAPDRVLAVAAAYRDFALGHPHLHALLSSPGTQCVPGAYPQTRELCRGLLAQALTCRAVPSGRTAGPGRDGPATRALPARGCDPADLLWACLHGMVCTELAEGRRRTAAGAGTDPGEERLITGMNAMLAGLGCPGERSR